MYFAADKRDPDWEGAETGCHGGGAGEEEQEDQRRVGRKGREGLVVYKMGQSVCLSAQALCLVTAACAVLLYFFIKSFSQLSLCAFTLSPMRVSHTVGPLCV